MHNTDRKESFLNDLFAQTEQNQNMNNKQREIFVKKNSRWYLAQNDEVSWDTQPTIESFVFLKHTDAGIDKLYTILGDYVTDSACSLILAILNFWMLYMKDGKFYISYLEPNGTRFHLTYVREVEAVGLLSSYGIVIKQNGAWHPFRVSVLGLIPDSNPTKLSEITQMRLHALLRQGFSSQYLTYLCTKQGIQSNLTNIDQNKEWATANADGVRTLAGLAKHNTALSVGTLKSALSLNMAMATCLSIYASLKDLGSLLTTSE